MSLRGIFDGGGLRKQNGHWQSSNLNGVRPEPEEGLFSIPYQETTISHVRSAHNDVGLWLQDTGNVNAHHITLLPGHRYRVTMRYFVRCEGESGYTGNYVSASSVFQFGSGSSILNGNGDELNARVGDPNLIINPIILSRPGQTARITNINNYDTYSTDVHDTSGHKSYEATFSYDIIPDTVYECDYYILMNATTDFLDVDATGSAWGGTVSATVGLGVAITRVS